MCILTDDWLIANDYSDQDVSSITSSQQQYQAVQEKVRAAIQGLHRGATRLQPNPSPARTAYTEHDWDFFYHSLLAAPETRSAILTTMSSGKMPVMKLELRTQRATTLSDASARSNMQFKPPYESSVTSMQSSTPEPR